MSKTLYKSTTDKKISGLCAGIGEYADLDANVVRIIAVLLLFVSGVFPVVIAYFVMAALLPAKP